MESKLKKLNYAWEKLYDAVRVLASSNGEIRVRLESAYGAFDTLRVHTIPNEEFAQRLDSILEQKTGLATMSDDEASHLAAEIFDLFHDVKTAYDEE